MCLCKSKIGLRREIQFQRGPGFAFTDDEIPVVRTIKRQNYPLDSAFWGNFHGPLGCIDRFRDSAQTRITSSDIDPGYIVSRETFDELAVFFNAFWVIGGGVVIKPTHAVALPLRHTVHVLHCQLHILFGILRFAKISVRRSRPPIGARKIRVQGYGIGKGPQGLFRVPCPQLFHRNSILVHRCQG